MKNFNEFSLVNKSSAVLQGFIKMRMFELVLNSVCFLELVRFLISDQNCLNN